ncbi:MAG: hypothetical protein GF353_11485 [Candidatus Lokiarchaeota archaeon]|nr:hypothetical protein [Candidatus Lokiarchaeota archaeon]
MYTIAFENNDIIVRFNEDSVDKKLLADFLEFIEIEQIRKKSKLTEKQAETLAKEINQKVWDKLKNKVLREN